MVVLYWIGLILSATLFILSMAVSISIVFDKGQYIYETPVQGGMALTALLIGSAMGAGFFMGKIFFGY